MAEDSIYIALHGIVIVAVVRSVRAEIARIHGIIRVVTDSGASSAGNATVKCRSV